MAVALYDQIGEDYDATRRAEPAIVLRLIHHLRRLRAGRCLDLACGTGNYTAALAKAGLKVYGLDHSRRMIVAARRKREVIPWLLGQVERLPFLDGAFDAAVCTLAIHHFPSLTSAFGEVLRVIRPGRFVLFTATPEQMRGYWLNEYFPDAMAKSITQMPDLGQVFVELHRAGFRSVHTEPYEVAADPEDLFLYSGKHRPELYLDPRVRAGISTFTALAEPSEVEAGCERLAHDIQSGRIADVVRAHRSERGDYIFVVAEAE